VSVSSGAPGRPQPAVPLRPLLQEVYLLDLVEGLYGVYVDRIGDDPARGMIAGFLAAEADRRLRMLRFLEDRGLRPAAGLRRLFVFAGRSYGRVSSWLGDRVMLRIAASSIGRAGRAACAALDRAVAPDLVYFASLRARHAGDLRQDLEQRLIDTAPRRDRRSGAGTA
jgi:hypothetical protein